MIILEGCDCTGKTTFASMLSHKTGFEVVKGSSFEISELGKDGMFEHMMGLLDRKDIIIDRFLYSNLVYGKLFNYPMMDESQFDELVEKMDKNAMVVYLHAPEGTILYRMARRGDDMIKSENIPSILSEYKDVLSGDFRPKMCLQFDTSVINFNHATSMVKDIYETDTLKTFLRF
jgi:thymidylate kinase